ncbi:MAG: hypothetical protein QXH27_03315 [Candidatus Micrarchaeia archaeon]
MKGFFSFFLVVVALGALFAGSQAYLKNLQTTRSAESELLLVERAHAAEMDAKHALLDGIRENARGSDGRNTEEISFGLAARFQALEAEVGKGGFHGFNASLWCGVKGASLAVCANPLSIAVITQQRSVFITTDIILNLRDERANASFTSFIPAGTVVWY